MATNDNKMVIAHAIYGLKSGGAERLLVPFACNLDKDKFRTIVLALTCSGPLEDILRQNGADVRVLRRDGKFGLNDLFRLVKILKEEKADIVHTHLQNADLWAGSAARICRIKHISTFHGAYYKHTICEFVKQMARVRLPQRIIAVSCATAEHCIYKLKANKNNVCVVYNGIGPAFLAAIKKAVPNRTEFGIKPEDIILGSFGRLEGEKGHVYLLQAAGRIKKSFPNIKVLIAGEGSFKSKLASLAQNLGISKEIILLGELSDITGLLATIDIAVFPSLSEGMPMSCLEAMAAGKPVVATRTGGIPELIEDNSSGILVRPHDEVSLSEGILRLISDRPFSLKLGQSARERVVACFSEDKMLEGVCRIYNEIQADRLPVQ